MLYSGKLPENHDGMRGSMIAVLNDMVESQPAKPLSGTRTV